MPVLRLGPEPEAGRLLRLLLLRHRSLSAGTDRRRQLQLRPVSGEFRPGPVGEGHQRQHHRYLDQNTHDRGERRARVQAANEECPVWEGQPVTGHWGMPDPVEVEGNDAQKALAFQEAYGALKQRIDLFTALNVDSLSRLALQARIDDIGRISTEGMS